MDCTIPRSVIGPMVTMAFNSYNTELTEENLNSYLESSINKVFAILGIYEDCEKNNNFDGYYAYLTRITTEFFGIYKLFDNNTFFSLVGVLNGMKEDTEPNHKKVKSLTFHCISLIKKGIK